MTFMQQLETSDIWLHSACKQVSPNFDERPNNTIDLLVIHNISLPPACSHAYPRLLQHLAQTTHDHRRSTLVE